MDLCPPKFGVFVLLLAKFALFRKVGANNLPGQVLHVLGMTARKQIPCLSDNYGGCEDTCDIRII